MPDFEKFLGDFPLLIGHNVNFDLSFLKHHLSLKYITAADEFFLDTAALAGLVWPGLGKYSLAYLLEFTGIKRDIAHRAYADAEATGELYLRELSALIEFPEKVKTFAAGLLFGGVNRSAVLQSLISIDKSVLPDSPEHAGDYGDNVIGKSSIRPNEDYEKIDIEQIKSIFTDDLPKAFSDFEDRPQQLAMAAEVARAFNQSEALLMEAPTGVGKSLAYLIPAIKWAEANGEPVTISTQTKNLQDQLFNKDIPLVKKALDLDFKAVLLKGRGNYVCLFKYYELLNEAVMSFGAGERNALLPLVNWVETTRTGDIAECGRFNPSRQRYLWSRISCEGNFCLGRACRYYNRCFLFRARNEAATAHLRIINHYLLFADFAAGGDLIRSSGHLIADEAHNLERVAASYLGPQLNHGKFRIFFSQIFTIRPIESGFLAMVKAKVMMAKIEEEKKIIGMINELQRKLLMARDKISTFFDQLSGAAIKHRADGGESREIRYFDLRQFVPPELADECRGILANYESVLQDFAIELELCDDFKESDELAVRARALAQDLHALRQAFEFLVYPDDDDYVYWIDIGQKREAGLVSAPLEVGKILDERLYESLKTIIFCSATLSVAGDFSYYKKRLGLDLSASGRTCHLALDSPFDLVHRVGFFEAGFMAEPNSRSFEIHGAEAIYELFSTLPVRGMALFTSYRNITGVVNHIGQKLIESGFDLFVQDGTLSPFQLLSRFRRSPKGIIFGTDSFWEGVDLPGQELELLVIFKLPFAVPDRPWIKANLDKIKDDGGNPFMEFSLPEAVIKFRQGFGRLIRKKTDSGCVIVLDSRLSGKRYGRYFADSVKPRRQRYQELGALVKAAADHFKAMAVKS